VDLKLAVLPSANANVQEIFDMMNKSEVTLHIGTIIPGAVWSAMNVSLPFNGNDEDFNVFFDASNGFWHEALRYRGPAGHRTRAVRVWRQQSSGKEKIVLDLVDKEYPRNATGEPDWGK
jgi:hypothetical protein